MRKLSEVEIKWIEDIFKVDFKDKDVLITQVQHCLVTSTYNSGFISLKFHVDIEEKYPHSVRVPVEMRVFLKDRAPIVFLIHVIQGYLDELEIFSADGSEIDVEKMLIDKIEYVVDPVVSCK